MVPQPPLLQLLVRLSPPVLILVCVALSGCDNQPAFRGEVQKIAGQTRSMTLTGEEIGRLGIRTEPARTITFTPRVRGYGVVADLSRVAQLDADLHTAEASATQSAASLKRAHALYGKSAHAISLESLEAAEKQAEADQIQVQLAERREIAAYGQNAPWLNEARRGDILPDLTTGHLVLVEATFPLGETLTGPPSSLVVTRLNTQPDQLGSTATLVWDAPADPTIPGRSFYALITGSDLAQGEHVLVFAPTGSPSKGVIVPAEAIVLSDNQAWCYVLASNGKASRISISLSEPVEGGYFIQQGIAAGAAIVVRGGGLLLARELGPTTSEQD
jgi:hypothetical protein